MQRQILRDIYRQNRGKSVLGEQSVFLRSSIKEFDAFFKKLSQLQSPEKENFFVRSCLKNTLELKIED